MIKTLRSSLSSEETPKRNAEVQVSTAEEPIVAKLKRRLEGNLQLSLSSNSNTGASHNELSVAESPGTDLQDSDRDLQAKV